jgi:hypothetical protein
MPNIVPSIDAPLVAPPRSNPASSSPTVWGVSPLFDFEKRRFIDDGMGDIVVGNDTQSALQYIRKALSTERFKWRGYKMPRLGFFGSEVPTLLGKSYAEEVKITLAGKFTREAIQYDSRIQGITNIQVTVIADQMYISFTVTFVNSKKLQFDTVWNMH